MKTKIIAATAATLVSANAFAMSAYFTGRYEAGWSVTRQPIISCEYEFNGQRFWETFAMAEVGSHCPVTIEVE